MTPDDDQRRAVSKARLDGTMNFQRSALAASIAFTGISVAVRTKYIDDSTQHIMLLMCAMVIFAVCSIFGIIYMRRDAHLAAINARVWTHNTSQQHCRIPCIYLKIDAFLIWTLITGILLFSVFGYLNFT